ncbi:MAG: hypothetical protein KF862_27165 [Chitinophagaceae bacterium]|nr:hypothetical protein [Chitinophagaceae bacterium]
MADTLLDPAQGLQTEIEKSIKHRRTYELMDFRLAHIFLWASIIASFASSIIIASGLQTDKNKIFITIIAGIPGLIILVDKTFDFATRAVWGARFRIELEELRDKLVFKKIEPYEASKEFRELSKRHELAYAKIGFFAKNKSDQAVTDKK